ncbi:MAG TPA: hypothetical protein VMR81_04640 [Patescibacteria group bacterium]|nr:hypothetical protein [Patescibacteria group bacterium]
MNSRFVIICIKIIPVVIAVFAIIEIFCINELAGSGKVVESVDNSIASLRQENDLLDQQVASASSLMTIASKSQLVGFIVPNKSQYLTVTSDELPVALHTQ